MEVGQLSAATLLPDLKGTRPRIAEYLQIPSSLSTFAAPFEVREIETKRNLWFFEDEAERSNLSTDVVEIEYPTPKSRLDVKINQSAKHMITDKVKAALDHLYPLLEEVAKKNYVPVEEVEVSGFVDPEEGDQEIVVSQCVGLSPRAALDYWDKLGAAVDSWTERLPPDIKGILIERISLEVQWKINEPTI